jgi:hypothetical protein
VPDPPTFEVEAEATVFGFNPTPLHAVITPRSHSWRVGGAARTIGVSIILAPVVAIFPPHAVWPIGALLTGGVLARKRYVERFTLETVKGSCPKCGDALTTQSTMLRTPHELPCDGCHHASILRLPDGTLEANAAD